MTKKEEMLILAKEYHKGQTRNNGKVPYWYHVLSVSEIVGNALIKCEGIDENSDAYQNIVASALGHDLYEDTKIDRKIISEKFGKIVDGFMWELTNEKDDENRNDYLGKIKVASEEAQLIKLADQIDNCLSCAYAIHELGTKWTREFLVPIVEEMLDLFKNIKFKNYPKTGEHLYELFIFSNNRLLENLKKFEGERYV